LALRAGRARSTKEGDPTLNAGVHARVAACGKRGPTFSRLP
jgi:hypothetical protein